MSEDSSLANECAESNAGEHFDICVPDGDNPATKAAEARAVAAEEMVATLRTTITEDQARAAAAEEMVATLRTTITEDQARAAANEEMVATLRTAITATAGQVERAIAAESRVVAAE